jgi:Flp pilus assembly protein TadD
MDDVLAIMQLASSHHQAGRFAQAEACYRQALVAQPGNPDAYFKLGLALHQQGRFSEAMTCYQDTIELKPDFVEAHLNLGLALNKLGESGAAIACLRQALQLRPDYPGAHLALGAIYNELGQLEEACCCCEKELQYWADNADAHFDLGLIWQQKLQLHKAIACFDRAIQLRPDYAVAHWQKALAHLKAGDFESGWREYEWRWQWPHFHTPNRQFLQPRWDGTDIAGRTLLIHAEQGSGDTIQFIRYAPILGQAGGRVIVETQPPLCSLLQSLPAVAQVVSLGDALPPFDVHIPLLSLPWAFHTTLQTIPAQVPYLTAPKDPPRGRLPLPDAKLKVGLVWAGNPNRKEDKTRSTTLSQLLPLLAAPGITFCSLQVGPKAAEIAELGNPAGLLDVAPYLRDFADTAAVMD